MTWLRAVPYALIAALLVAVPSDVIDTPLFGRPVEVRAIDYVTLAITAGLIGLIFAIRVQESEATKRQGSRTVWGGFVSFLAVGCPVCNQLVVAVVGTSGALAWWAPVQPLVGLAAIGLLLWTLRYRLQTYRAEACPVPVERRSVPVDQWAGERSAIGGEVGGGEADVNQM